MSEQQKSSVGTIAWDNILNKLHTRINTRPDVNQGQGDETCETDSSYTKHQQNLQTTYSHRTNNEYLHEFTKTRDSTNENYDSDIETTSDYPTSQKSDFAEYNRDYKPKFHQPSQKLRTRTNYKTETTEEEIGSALIPTGHIVDRINFDRVLKTLPKDEKFRAPPSRESVFQGKTVDLFGKLGNLAKNEIEKSM